MKKPEEQLQEFRARIDRTDELISELLILRTQVIREVAKLKAAHWPGTCHIRPAREGQMHRAVAKRFEGTSVPPRMALAVWRQLIGGSTHLESPLNVTYLRPYPEHRFLAREYFGVQIGASYAGTLSDALMDIRSGKSNILVLPHPESHGWWSESSELQRMGLRIFAAIPVETGILPADCTPAVALAAVAPEDSGNDVSYFINAQGGLEIVPGFVTMRDGTVFLGAHPLPISLPAGASHG